MIKTCDKNKLMVWFESKSLLLNEYKSSALFYLEAPLFWDLSASFWFFLLIINRESHGVVFGSTNEKILQNQVYR